MPDGGGRTQINPVSAASEYEVIMANGLIAQKEQIAIKTKLIAMQSEMAILKAYVKSTEMERMRANYETEEALRNPKIKASPTDTVIRIGATQTAKGESAEQLQKTSTPQLEKTSGLQLLDIEQNSGVEITPDSVIFRVRHPFAKTEFVPSKSMREQILKVARDGYAIEVRGRTDADHTNKVDRNIALARAVNAHIFLVTNGIPENKIKVSFLSAGDFVADNSTKKGNALNRRVELEVKGVHKVALL